MNEREEKAYAKGVKAAQSAESKYTNPYTHETSIQSANYWAWLAGYRSVSPDNR